MKRRISFLLALAIVLTFIPFNSFAAGKYDKKLEEAIVKSKELFNIGPEYDKFDHSASTRDGQMVFYMNWSDSKGKLGSMDVSMTEDGSVISYGKWKPNYEEHRPKLPKVSKEEGLKVAENFIKKVSPKFANNIKYIDRLEPLNVNSDGYSYYFVRTEKGVPYYNNSIDIYVDNTTGEVRNYYTNWDMDLSFPDVKDIISLEEAEKLYKDKIGLELLYNSSYVDDNPKKYLAYGPLNSNLGINAKDGEVVSLNDYYRIHDVTADMKAGNSIEKEELSPGERQAVDSIAGLITQAEAEKISREILGLDSEYKLEYASLYKNYRNDNDYSWNMDFSKGKDSKYYYAYVNINAKTKELISFNHYEPEDGSKKVQYNEEKSLEIAKEYIKKMNLDKFELIELKERPEIIRPLEEQRSYSFEFIRKIDNAYVPAEGITVSVDAVNGRISQYGINWSKGNFPSKDKVISKEKAHDILFKDVGMELKYISLDRYGTNLEKNRKAILVYGLKSEKPANIDANTGIILNYRGEPFKVNTIISYKDIDKSYAKGKINILAQYGIALPGEEFKPKEKIKQKDFLYLLIKANNPYFEIDGSKDNLYNYLINAGIVKEGEEAPEEMVTKEEGIKYIIRALKYDKIADINEIYKDLFKDTKDIDKELKGYVSIAYGLGIVQGSNGNLNPKAELKREDAANMIYNYLFTGN